MLRINENLSHTAKNESNKGIYCLVGFGKIYKDLKLFEEIKFLTSFLLW